MKIVAGILFAAVLFAACNDDKKVKTDKTSQNGEVKKETGVAGVAPLDAPDFSNPELRQYYSNYTGYIKRVAAAIDKKDEAATMKLFREEGMQFNNLNEMEQKAQAEESAKFNTWLRQAIPYQTIIAKSDYYKKYNEEYYKKVKEDFEKKNN